MENDNKRDPNPNRLNIYICDTCGEHLVTKDADKGTTPFMIGCRCTEGCRGKMASSFYRVFDPDGRMKWTHEWYRPTLLHLAMTPAVQDHVRNGGLLLRQLAGIVPVNQFTHLHLKRQSRYRVLGEVRLQIGEEISDGFGKCSDLDGVMFTLYQGEDGVYNARHPDEFNDGRFQEIDNG